MLVFLPCINICRSHKRGHILAAWSSGASPIPECRGHKSFRPLISTENLLEIFVFSWCWGDGRDEMFGYCNAKVMKLGQNCKQQTRLLAFSLLIWPADPGNRCWSLVESNQSSRPDDRLVPMSKRRKKRWGHLPGESATMLLSFALMPEPHSVMEFCHL